METLQIIWNTITTENEGLIKIINIPLAFIEIYITTILFTIILNIVPTNKQKFSYILILSVISSLTQFFMPVPYNSFINVIIALILMHFIFKLTFLKSIIAFTIPYVITVVLGTLLINLYIITFNITSAQANIIPIYRLSFSLILYSFLFIFSKLFKHFNFNISLTNSLEKKTTKTLLINFIIGILAITIQSYIATFYSNSLSPALTLFNLAILFLYFCISFYSLSRTSKLEETTRDLEGEKLVNKSLTILHDNIRAFKHDFNNIVQAIGGYITTNDMEGLKSYYSQLLDDCQRVNNLTTLSPEVINNPAIYSILASKYYKADELGIKINLEIFLDLNTLKIKIYELTRILGILLDNAIEATLDCSEKVINVIMRKDDTHHRQLIIIENSYSNKNINLDKIFEKSYSTKPNNTGLGLWEVRQILKKNNNLNLYTTKDNKFFKQQLEIYI